MAKYLVLKRTVLADGKHYSPEVITDPHRADLLVSRGFILALDPVEAARGASAPPVASTPETLGDYDMKDLATIAKQYGVKGYSGLKKDELIAAIKASAGYAKDSPDVFEDLSTDDSTNSATGEGSSTEPVDATTIDGSGGTLPTTLDLTSIPDAEATSTDGQEEEEENK